MPSYLKRKRSNASCESSKRAKTVQHYDRDIVCLPNECGSSKISFPRGKYRSKLAASGLIGKIHLVSSMTVEEVETEVRSVFSRPMGGRNDFPFVYLQSTGAGTRTLTIPCLSPSFKWTAQQVAKLGTCSQAVYILAKEHLIEDNASEV